MNRIFDSINSLIYNVYHKEVNSMSGVVISKWGNSLGFRIPNNIAKSLDLKPGDKLNITELENSINITKCKESSVEEILCNFYGKKIDEILSMKITDNEKEIDWGEDVGAEVIK